MLLSRIGVLCGALLAVGPISPLSAEVPYDGWRGQRSAAGFAGDRRPLDGSPRSGRPYAAAPAYRSEPDFSGRSKPSLWTGLYAGGHLGGTWGDATLGGLGTTVSMDGFSAGGHVGYNMTMGPFVGGLEIDGSWAGIDGARYDRTTAVAGSVDIDWMATLRGRLGVAWDNVLLYGTAGVAFAGIDLGIDTAGAHSISRDSLAGFVWGGGVELMISPQLSARIEALRTNFGDTHLGTAAGSLAVGADVTTVRAGISWHFN